MQTVLASLTFLFAVAFTMVTGIAAGYAVISGLLALFGQNRTAVRVPATTATASVQGD